METDEPFLLLEALSLESQCWLLAVCLCLQPARPSGVGTVMPPSGSAGAGWRSAALKPIHGPSGRHLCP